jgi:saccharopepsin
MIDNHVLDVNMFSIV